jgi:subtilisin family serine protease
MEYHMHRARPAFILALMASVTACTDSAAPSPDLSLESSPTHPGMGRHILLLSRMPGDAFAQEVTTLGGRIEWIAGGMATLSGLDESGRQLIARRNEVRLIVSDVSLSLDPPAGGLDVVAVGAVQPRAPGTPGSSALHGRQWNMRAIAADKAWAAGALGSPSVTAFILDSGIDYRYSDLLGLVDESRSIDLTGSFPVEVTIAGRPTVVTFTEADTVARYFPTRKAFTDLYFHGTHVAATVSSNAFVAAGVTSRTRLVAVKVCTYLNICPFSSVLRGILHAADHGADIINVSLGGSFHKQGNGQLVRFINQAFTHARSRGVTVVVAAGNDAADLDHDVAGYSAYCDAPGVICTAATGPTNQSSVDGPFADVDASASYTNFGRSAIDLAAPGGNINAPMAPNTFVYAGCSQTSLVIPVCRTGVFAVGSLGTSMAAPHVSGAVSLLVPRLGRNPAAIDAHLRNTLDDLGQPGADPRYGRGRLNVARAAGILP